VQPSSWERWAVLEESLAEVHEGLDLGLNDELDPLEL